MPGEEFRVRVIGRRGPTGSTRALPRVLLHGTSIRNVPGILQEGLTRGEIERANAPEYGQSVQGCVFLAEEEKTARFFAEVATHGMEGPPRPPPHDLAIFYVDTLHARLRGVYFVPTTFVSGIGGHEWETCDNIVTDDISQLRIVQYRKEDIFGPPLDALKQYCDDPDNAQNDVCRAVRHQR